MKKTKIGIELNGVLRNFNRQMLKYYVKDINPMIDLDEINEKCDKDVENAINFDTKKERNSFIYIDYPFELFGCAKMMEKNLANTINNWIDTLGEDEEAKYEVEVFSRNEEALALQGSYFFLSKTAFRVRNAFFPEKDGELENRYDYMFTASPETAKFAGGECKIIFITQDNSEKPETVFKEYKTMTDAVEDNNVLNETEDKHEEEN